MTLIKRIWTFYLDGFRQMTVGRTLWIIIIIKLVVIFAILRLFFFRPVLKGTESQKADSVRVTLLQNTTSQK